MVIEDDAQANRPGVSDNRVHILQRGLPDEGSVCGSAAGIGCVVAGHWVGFHHLVGERDTDHVVAEALDGVQDGLVVLCPQPVDEIVAGFESIPVDSRNTNFRAVRVENLVAAGMPVSRPLGPCAGRDKSQRNGPYREDFVHDPLKGQCLIVRPSKCKMHR